MSSSVKTRRGGNDVVNVIAPMSPSIWPPAILPCAKSRTAASGSRTLNFWVTASPENNLIWTLPSPTNQHFQMTASCLAHSYYNHCYANMLFVVTLDLLQHCVSLCKSWCIIRPHRSATYVDAVCCYRLSSMVCRFVSHTSEPSKNG